MACMAQAIGQSLEHAYAHHIQRLMVIGNFALLAGLDPQALHQWYLGIYIDAFEWVELPNTLGMSQFGDGGLLATKPYVSSAAYIDRMSDYCKGCQYDKKARVGERACPASLSQGYCMHEQYRPGSIACAAFQWRPWVDQRTAPVVQGPRRRVPAGASGSRASTRCTILSARSCSP
mgnify:CR=1 FL=1